MQNIEESALSTYRQTIPLWLRKVDDTFTAVRQDEIVAFHRHLNGQNTDIQFTREDESKCIEYKQGTVGNWLPIAANECVCVCVCVCMWCGGRGGRRKDITESYGGDQVNLSYWRTKILLPPPLSPRWWIMTSPHLVIYSYIFFLTLDQQGFAKAKA